jgi:hypothetical protein
LNLKCSGGPPVNLRPPLFRHRSRATRERRGRAAASHTAPPDRGAGPTSPTPRRCVAPPVAHPPLPVVPPFLFPQVLPREHAPEQYIAPSSLSSASCPRRPTGLPSPRRLRAAAPSFHPQLGDLCRALVIRLFWTVPHLPDPLLQLQDSSTPSPAT